MALDALKVELTVVLGKARLPIGRVLRLGRGSTVLLDGSEDELVEVLGNGVPIARGRVLVREGALSVEVTELCRKPEVDRTLGATLGRRVKAEEG